MAWSEFLNQLKDHHSVTLVGPLLGNPHTNHQPTIYVDGGVRFRDPKSNFPQISIGDGDSAPLQLDKNLPERKDYSDLAFVLRHLPTSIKRVELAGFWGGRRDHEMAVFGELHVFLKSSSERQVYFRTDSDRTPVWGYSQGRWSFEVQGLFSILAIEPTQIQLTGACDYQLKEPVLFGALSSLGVSNVGRGTIELNTTSPAFVFLV